MPSTIDNHAIDFNNDNYIDLKIPIAYASAANYLKMGWNKEAYVFIKLILMTSFQKIFECFAKNS